jgi:hypothetical protein
MSKPQSQLQSFGDTASPLTDGASWVQSLLLRLAVACNSLVNEFVQLVQFICTPTTGTSSYEKAGVLIEGEQRDPSDYSNSDPSKWTMKDAVGVSSYLDIAAGNQKGRAWGVYTQAGCKTGCDGMMTGIEIGLNNNGSDQPNLATPTTKTALTLVAAEYPGNKPGTAAISITGGQSQWHKGMTAKEEDFVETDPAAQFIALTGKGSDAPVFEVKPNGSTTVRGSLKIRFVSAATLKTEPGELVLWGDTGSGLTYLVFDNGGAQLLAQFTGARSRA